MVVPIGNLANKLFSSSNFSSSTMANSQASLIPTVFPNNMGIDFPTGCHMQVHPSGNNVPAVKPPPNHTSLPSMAVTFLTTYLMAVLQPSGYSIFHDRDTPIQLSLP